MKKTNLRLLCAVLGIVMLLTALPISAESADATITPFDATVDFEFGSELKFINGTGADGTTNAINGDIRNYIKSNTDIEVRTPFDYGASQHCFIKKNPAGSGYSLRIESGNSWFAVKDVNQKLADADFTVSADFYLNLSQATANLPLIQWSRNELISGKSSLSNASDYPNFYRIVSTSKSGELIAGGKNLDIYLNGSTWYNITANVKYAGNDTYEISLFLDGQLIYVYSQVMSAPSADAASYIVFYSRDTKCQTSYLDNIHIYETPENTEVTPEVLDTTLEFDNCGETKSPIIFVSGTDTPDTDDVNVSEFLNTDLTAVTFPIDNGYGRFVGAVKKDPVNNSNLALKVVNKYTFVSIEDVKNKLDRNDFVVSADMYLNFDLSAFTTGSLNLLQWRRGASVKDSTKYVFVSVDNKGQLIADGKELGVFVNQNEWFNLSATVKHLSNDTYEISLFLDGKLIFAYKQEMPAADKSYILFLDSNVFGFANTYIDNLKVREYTEESDVIWNVDFNGLGNGDQMDWSSVSSGYAFRSTMGGKATVDNGALKISAPSAGAVADLYVGRNGKSILDGGNAAISMKLKLETADSDATIENHVLSWRRLNAAVDILSFKGDDLIFCDVTLADKITVDEALDVKVVINGSKYLADLYIGGDKVVDSAPIFGDIYSEAVTNSFDGSDFIRLFQASADTDAVYYVDDLKIEKAYSTDRFLGFDFTGWSGYDSSKGPQNGISDANMALALGGIAFKNSPPIVVDGDKEYIKTVGSDQIFLGDLDGELLFKKTVIEFDIYVGSITATSTKTILSFDRYGTPYDASENQRFLGIASDGKTLVSMNGKNITQTLNDGWNHIRLEILPSTTLNAWNRLVYYVNDSNEPFADTDFSDAAFNMTGLTNYFHDGSNDASTYQPCSFVAFRFFANGAGTIYWDNIKLYTIEDNNDVGGDVGGEEGGDTEEYIATPIELDFNGDYTSALAQINANYFPVIGSTRTDSTGATVTCAEVLTEGENSYLRINHNKLTANQSGYIVAENYRFIGLDQYLIETDFRYTCDVGYGVSVATLVSDNYTSTFTPVGVIGAKNTLYASIRGLQYDLYTKAGKLIKVNTTDDKEFTKLAILVDEGSLTYTVYVDGSVAYYYYDGEYIPCANLPITFKDSGFWSGAKAQLRLLEINPIVQNDCTLDISRVTVKALPSGVTTEFKATQSRVDDLSASFDVRFIAGIDSLYGSKVGFTVETEYEGKAHSKEVTSNLVYSSVIDGDYTVTAESLDCEYLFVVSVNDLPQSAGEVTFKVTSFVEHDGVRVAGKTQTVTATYAGGKVTLK